MREPSPKEIQIRTNKLKSGLSLISAVCAALHFMVLLLVMGAGPRLFHTFAPQCQLPSDGSFFKYFFVLITAYLIYWDLIVLLEGSLHG